ncbi:MAG: rhomboid family intramembrane serine protease [Pseudomonadota bacterium]
MSITAPKPPSDRPRPAPPPRIVWIMVGAFALIEGALQLADLGILPIELRVETYILFAFWDQYFDGVLDGRTVPVEFWSSLVTHAFLHGGAVHLLLNGAIFLGIGGMLAHVLGPVRFIVLFVICAIGGALAFGIIATFQGPLVGASGAIFGFLGALKRYEWKYIQKTGISADRFWRTIAGLAAINVLLAFVPLGGGGIAWQAHLGGFIAGFLIAPVLAPRFAAPSPI